MVVDGCTDVILVVTATVSGVVSATAVNVVIMSAMMTLRTMIMTIFVGGDGGGRGGLG